MSYRLITLAMLALTGFIGIGKPDGTSARENAAAVSTEPVRTLSPLQAVMGMIELNGPTIRYDIVDQPGLKVLAALLTENTLSEKRELVVQLVQLVQIDNGTGLVFGLVPSTTFYDEDADGGVDRISTQGFTLWLPPQKATVQQEQFDAWLEAIAANCDHWCEERILHH